MVDLRSLNEPVFEESPLIDLSWESLSCSIKAKKGEKTILKSVSGQACHGEFLVIMGSSGAGKTTLLNILSGRLHKSNKVNLSGDIKVNQRSVSDILFSNYIGYVTQEDNLIETLTVFECLLFIAELKTDYPNKKEKVLDLIKMLKLENCQNSYIGGQYVKGISGGERKRTSIGIELITNPSILFLDEPTSGLDSYTAMIVIKLLLTEKKLGKTVISTIHQPSSDIFYLFDKLMLMCDGQIVFHGIARSSIKFFADAGFSCPIHSNPADFFMEILYIKNSNELTNEEKDVVSCLVNFFQQNKISYDLISAPLSNSSQRYTASFYTQITHLTKRNF